MLLMAEQGAQLLTPAQVAELLQVHRDTVLRWIREGKLKKVQAGRAIRIRRRDLDTFLEQKQQ